MRIADSICCTAESNTTLWINYTPIKIFKKPTHLGRPILSWKKICGYFSEIKIYLCIKKRNENRGLSKCQEEEACYPAPTFGEDWKACRQESGGAFKPHERKSSAGLVAHGLSKCMKEWARFSHPRRENMCLCSLEYSSLRTFRFWIFMLSALTILNAFISKCTVLCCLNGLVQRQGAYHSEPGWLVPIQWFGRYLLFIDVFIYF